MTPLDVIHEAAAAIGMGVLVLVTVADGLLTKAPSPFRGQR